MRQLHSSIGVLNVATLGGIIHDEGRSVRLRISRSNCRPNGQAAMFKVDR